MLMKADALAELTLALMGVAEPEPVAVLVHHRLLLVQAVVTVQEKGLFVLVLVCLMDNGMIFLDGE